MKNNTNQIIDDHKIKSGYSKLTDAQKQEEIKKIQDEIRSLHAQYNQDLTSAYYRVRKEC